MTSKELKARNRSDYEPSIDKRPLGAVARVHGSDVPFGSTGDDLYDEELYRRFRRKARTVAALAGMTCAFVVASWAFACMPGEYALGISWGDGGRIDPSLIPGAYAVLRYYAPVVLGMLALPAFALASVRSIDLRIEFFYGEEPPSATIFDSRAHAGTRGQMLAWSGVAIVVMGLCLAATAPPHGPLWGSPWEWLAHVACCVCVSAGSGLVASRAALAFVAARSRCIDDYDLLIPDCGADDDYRRRVYLDHATGIARLLGCAFALFSMSVILSSIPDNPGTVRVCGETLVESSSLLDGAVRAVWALKALSGLAPAVVAMFALALLAKVLLRSWRFAIEWSIIDVPSYFDAYEAVRAGDLSRAALSSGTCIALHLCKTALSGALADGSLAGAPVSGLASTVVLLSIGMLLELAAGFAIGWVARYALTSRAAYDAARSHLSPFDDYTEECAALDGLALMRRVTYVLGLSSLAVSAMAVTSLVHYQPIVSWGTLAASILSMLGVL